MTIRLAFLLRFFLPVELPPREYRRTGHGRRLATLLALAMSCAIGMPAAALETVTLQLKYRHQFQFAGYYAAIEQGYYRDAGLDVRLLEGNGDDEAERKVLNGDAEYGVSDSSLLLSRAAGKPLVVLGVIFQHSAYVLAVPQDGPIKGIRDVVGKNLMINAARPHSIEGDDLLVYLKKAGIDISRLALLAHSHDANDLVSGKVDAMSVYITNEPDFFSRIGFPVQLFSPREAGIDFYGDNLFTSEREIALHPARVRAFRAASMRGWQYAMSRPEAISDLIIAKYSRQNTRDHLLFEAHQMADLVQPQLIETGYMNPLRWQQIADHYADAGMLPKKISLDGFLYDPNANWAQSWMYRIGGVLAAIIMLLVILQFWRMVLERRRVQRHIRKSEERWNFALEGAGYGVWDWNIVTGEVMYSKRWQEMHGYPDKEFSATLDASRARVHPDDLPALSAIMRNYFAGKTDSFISEHRILCRDGSWLWGLDRGMVVSRDKRGKPLRMIATRSDITRRKMAEAALTRKTAELQSQAAFMHAVIENIPIAVLVKDVRDDFRITLWNRAAEAIFQRPKDRAVGRLAGDIWSRADAEAFLQADQQALREGRLVDIAERWVQTELNGMRLLHIIKVPLINEETQQVDYLLDMCEDITERRQNERRLQLAALVYEHSSEAMLVNDADNNIISINPAFTAMTGYQAADVLGKNPRIFASGHHDHTFYKSMWDTLLSNGQWQGEVWNRRRDGSLFAELLSINLIRNADGSVHQYVGLFSDITKKKESETLIWHQANFDALTKLPNRRMFRDRLEQGIKKSKRDGLPLAILFIDLDRFKEVNDTLGHDVGDSLLIEAAHRIRRCVRESDTVARQGGDEFTVLLFELEDTARVSQIALNINEALAAPFELGDEMAFVSGSIGITLYPNDALEIDDLLKHADQALYVAKDGGRNRFAYFTPALQVRAQNRMRLTNDLRSALRNDELHLYFQPIVNLATGAIEKAEALIRWQHPRRGMVGPNEFIPLAEASGLILDIGEWVFKEAAQWVQRWRAAGFGQFQISVNQSPLEFQRDDNGYARWFAYLQELGLHGSALVIEITESLLLDASNVVMDKLLHLRDSGIQVALDDFGTGYSSLSYLKKFDIDYLKIDQSFTRNLFSGSPDMALSEAIIVMAHKLGLKVIAEGVETQTQYELLRAAGCDYAQGYLFSRPVPAADFDQLLVSGRALIDG